MFDRYFNLSISTQTPHRLKSMRDWKNRRPQEVYLYSQGAACQPNSGCEDCLRMFEIVLSFEGKSKHGVPLFFLCTYVCVICIYIYCMILYLYVMVMIYAYTVPGTVPYTYIDIDLQVQTLWRHKSTQQICAIPNLELHVFMPGWSRRNVPGGDERLENFATVWEACSSSGAWRRRGRFRCAWCACEMWLWLIL